MADLPPWARNIAEPLYELAEKADRHKDPRILQIIKTAAISGNQRAIASVQQRLTVDAANRMIEGKVFTSPAVAEIMAHADPVHSLVLGRVLDTDLTVLYAVKLTRQHLLVIGATGEGKTNFLFVLVIQFVRFGSVWIFEGGMKTDFRHLIPAIDDLLVFNPETFPYNCYQVPTGVRPEIVLRSAEENFTHVNWLLHATRSMMRTAQHGLFRERGMFVGNRNDFPTLIDIRHRIAAQKVPGYSRSAGYKDSLLNRLDAFISEAPNLYAVQKGIPTEEMSRRSFVYELQSLSPQHGAFQTFTPVDHLLQYRIANGLRGEKADPLLIVMDEAKWIAPERNDLGFSPLEFFLAQARDLGVSFVFSDQTTELNPSLFTQCRLLMAFRVGGGMNLQAIRKAFALTDKQTNALHHLDVGQAVIRLPRVDPFILETPRFPIE